MILCRQTSALLRCVEVAVNSRPIPWISEQSFVLAHYFQKAARRN
jgi:hypothetical protein